MPTIKDLGRAFKKANPAYRDLTDEEAGRMVKKAYPDKYNDFEDTSLMSQSSKRISHNKPSQFKEMMNDLLDNTPLSTNSTMEKYSQGLDDFLNPKRGKFTAWWQNRKAEKRAELAQTLGRERMAVIEQTMQIADAVRSGKRSEIEFKQFVAQNAITLMEAQSLANRIIEADKVGIPEYENTSLKVEKLKRKQNLELYKEETQVDFEHYKQKIEFDAEQQRKQAEFNLQLKITEAKAMSQISINEEVEIADILADIEIRKENAKADREWTRYMNETNLNIKATILAGLHPIAEAVALTQHLRSVLHEIQEMKQLGSGEATLNAIAVLENSKKELEELINERYRLLKTSPRKKH